MTTTTFFQKLCKYWRQKTTYVVNVEVSVGGKYCLVDVEVDAYSKAEAKSLAIKKIEDKTRTIALGLKSKGKAKTLNQF